MIAHALVDEVSILSPSVKPAEPLAEVLSLKPTEEPRPVAREIPHRSGGMLVRPGVGRILAVR